MAIRQSLKDLAMEAGSELMLCMAPAARDCTLASVQVNSPSTGGIAPDSRATTRPSSWKQMLWMAPAALAFTVRLSIPRKRTRGATWADV